MNHSLLKSKLDVLSKMVVATKSVYDASTEDQKALLQTLAGAAIWYMPSGIELYSGKISTVALAAIELNPNTKLVEEHSFPRKIAGKLLFENAEKLADDTNYLTELYLKQFGKYNLVLKIENDRVKKYQKVDSFLSEQDAYERAGIQLVDFSKENYQEYKKVLARNKRPGK